MSVQRCICISLSLIYIYIYMSLFVNTLSRLKGIISYSFSQIQTASSSSMKSARKSSSILHIAQEETRWVSTGSVTTCDVIQKNIKKKETKTPISSSIWPRERGCLILFHIIPATCYLTLSSHR
eukprot:gene6261-4510_t